MRSYQMLDRFSLLPADGGLGDQLPAFIESVHLIEHERCLITAAADEQRENERRRARK